MMTLAMYLALVGVIAILAAALLIMRKWGPGIATRSVQCPERKVRAEVKFLRQEGEFGSLKVSDVVSCSLFADAPVACGKACLG